MRSGLYMFRHRLRLSQAEMAERIGCSRATYSAIESGTRDGHMTFWNNLKKAFGVSDAEIGGLMRVDEGQTQNDRSID